MAAKVAGCCEGLVSSIDEVPTISEIMHKVFLRTRSFPCFWSPFVFDISK
jgi:hypothetical protein